ncbi:protein of unknown function [Candidatus Nitrosotalea okcheonensis]|uniref:Uncharacterized protein n=1 Tax=Candidatus Nitrosotalea okcheonensis TaxID=1903276 RepID=A0A2H1FF88_9ARCH|nr:protein of unknown function [Candidatus Nitrosotalea okcheonensis]
MVSESDTTRPVCTWSTEYGERGNDGIETMPKFGKGNGIPREPVPACGTRFPGIGKGADIIVALAGPIVVDIDSTTNTVSIPKIDMNFFISA